MLGSRPAARKPADTTGMKLSGRWDQELAQFGNAPGLNAGDVTIELGTPVEGHDAYTVDSDAVTFGAESGNVIGLTIELADKRHLFIPWSNVTGIIDAAAGKGS
jgi:hypothetical protein